jgi:hypothetical protein
MAVLRYIQPRRDLALDLAKRLNAGLKNRAQQLVIARASPLDSLRRIHSCTAIAGGFGQFRNGKGKTA